MALGGDPDDAFPERFFDRADETDDGAFYAFPRLVTHIDDAAIAAVGELYRELEIDGDVLDLMSSWVSHFAAPPRHLRVLGRRRRDAALLAGVWGASQDQEGQGRAGAAQQSAQNHPMTP